MPRDTVSDTFPQIHSEKIPFEIWLQIIECSSLDHTDISHLTLVSKLLRYVAQPMLFANFRVTIIRARYLDSPTPVSCQHIAYRSRLKTRLEFASLPRIVQSVKVFDIRMGGERLDLDAQETVKEEEILGTLFQNIHHFTSLRSLFAQDVSLTGAHFDYLAELKYFNGIHLERCSCTGDLRLTRFRLKYLSLHGKMAGSYGWWLPLLQCSSLQHLSYDAVPGPPQDPGLFFPALSTGPIMHSMRTLRLPILAAFYPCFTLALSRCPSLENLYVDHRSDGQFLYIVGDHSTYPTLSPTTLPKLRAVSGPFGFVTGCILPGGRTQLRHIRVSSIIGDTRFLVDLIKQCRPELEELVVQVTAIQDNVWLQYIFTSMAALRGLHITYDGVNVSYKDVSTVLCPTELITNQLSLVTHCSKERCLPSQSPCVAHYFRIS